MISLDLKICMEEQTSIESPYPIPVLGADIKEFIHNIPKSPGVYKFLDQSGYPLYIGKAKLLNKRVASYFRKSSRTKKIEKLLTQAQFIEFALTNTELESLLHEQYLIKELKPKFNVQFKDDKGYPWIKIDFLKDFPSATAFLGKKTENGKFFGPFPSYYAVRDALKLIQKTFKLRNCSDSIFKNRTRPCLQHEIGRCSAPCTGLISKKDYFKEVQNAELLLSGKSEELIDNFYSSMDKFSLKKDYERAAIYRDRISGLRDIQRSQSVVGFKDSRDAVFVSVSQDITKVGVTSVNNGWVTGHQNFLQSKGFEDKKILETFLVQHYLSNDKCPQTLIVSQNLSNKELIEKALSKQHSKSISIITKPGKKDQGLLRISQANTEYSLFRKNNSTTKARLKKLSKELDIKNNIELIESYDVSHHSGQNAVAGCVVYSNEGKKKNLYRLYNISEKNSGNDIGAMIEVLSRRFSGKKISSIPDLIILDGGRVHLTNVTELLNKLNVKTNIISISKGIRRKAEFDRIHSVENGGTEKILSNEALLVVQEIRDETHRFTISSQKKKGRKKVTFSKIDLIQGVGYKKKNILLRYFGSIEQLKRASIDDLLKVPGIGKVTANEVFSKLK